MSVLRLKSGWPGQLGAHAPAGQITTVLPVFAGLAGVAAVGAAPIAQPNLWRDLFGAAIGLNLLVVALGAPRRGALVTLMFLPFQALVRRLLIPVAGWTSTDPLLLAAPLVAGFVWLRLFVIERRPLGGDRLSRLITALLSLVIIQSLSPLGPGIRTNLAGLLFLGTPLLWYFIGRELADDRGVRTLLRWVVATGLLVSLYSLWQTNVAFPAWDADWIKQAGYNALYITQTTVRAFGTLSSAQENAAYMGMALVIALVVGLHRRPLWLLAIALPLVAIFLESSRGILLTTVGVMVLMIALRPRNAGMALAVSVVAIAILATALSLARGSLSQSARSGNPLVAHQVTGLLNPTNQQDSTLAIHVSLIGTGLNEWAHHPFGLGAGSTTEAVTQLSGNSKSSPAYKSQTTENDFTNSLVALGPLGPLLLIPATLIAFARAIRRYFILGQPIALMAVGIMVLTLGTWLNGGQWATSPITWFVVGWAAGKPVLRPRRAAVSVSEKAVPAAPASSAQPCTAL